MKFNFNFLPTMLKNKLSPSPAGEVESRQSVPSNPNAVAQSASDADTPSPALIHTLIATFAIRNPQTGNITTEIVEVPHTNKPKVDIENAWKIIRARHPNTRKDDIRRSAGRIVSRPGGKNPVIAIRDGQTIRQLFPDRTDHEAARTVGTVVFEGSLCDVILRHIRAKSVFSVTLRQPGGTTVNFSEQITTTRLTEDLPRILVEIIGPASETLKLYLKK